MKTCGCGTEITLVNEPRYRGWNWTAYCTTCYDPTEDAGTSAHVTGRGATEAEALDDFADDYALAHDL